ncbi:Importin subunit [Dirofilaria immitis]
MGNRSSSPSSQMPPYLLGSGSGSKSISKHSTHYYTAPFIAQPYGVPAFHQSVSSLQHFSGNDSGYITSPADSERWRTNNWKIGNSCLSLNEAFFVDGPPGAPSNVFPMPTVISIPPPTLKQFKKWQKRQKKVLKKMSSIPASIIPPHASVTPLLQYSRAFSVDNLSRQVVDGYVNVPVTEKHKRNECGKVARNQPYNEAASEIPSGPLKSSFSSCSNGLTVSDLRMIHSAPSTNTSDRSHLTSTTEHSSSLRHQTSSPIQLKNSSNQNFQRIRLSNNDAGLAGTPRQFQQWNFVGKGGPSAIVQHETAGVIDEETNSEVRKSKIGPYSANINYKSRRTATNSDCTHSKTVTSYDCDERNYGYRNDSIANNNGDISTERNISVKVILEAEEIPENNIQLFSKNVTNPAEDDKIFPTDEIASNLSRQYNFTPGIATQNQTTQQIQLGYFPLKKSADYGSTISSLTQSSNMKTEVSDIDFSWVNDVENRLEREIAFVREDSAHQLQRKQLPVQYFGMDLQQSKIGKDEATIVTSPMYTITKSLEVFGECESRKELSQIQSDVRSKAAMFDNEAFRNERKVDEQQAAYRYRSRSTPRSNVYIHQPDYRSHDPISIDNSQQSCRYGNIHSSDVSVATGPKFDRCPKPYSKGSSNLKLNGNVTEVGAKCDDSYRNNNSEKIIKKQQQQQQQPYSDHGDEIMQRNRMYDATEYYIQNATRRNTEKPWRISVAY